MELMITVVHHDGRRDERTCAFGAQWEVALGRRLRFVVDARTPVSDDPWCVRLLDRDHVLDEWTFREPTERSISVNVRPAAAYAYLAVHSAEARQD
jgi:hypothetical protein